MPDHVDTTHPAYDEFLPVWEVVRDTVDGTRKIKREFPDLANATSATGRMAYLPRLAEQSDPDYLAYRNRALYVNFTSRALRAWTGLLFRKAPVWKAPLGKEILETDCDLQGRSLTKYIEMVGEDVASVGRAGTLIDWSESEERPYFSYYAAESIINWRVERVASRQTLTLLVLAEESPAGDTEFSHKTIERWRIYQLVQPDSLRMDLPAPRKVVLMTLYERHHKEFVVVDEREINRRGVPLTAIPFVFHSSNEQTDPAIPVEPPLEAISQINISHYRTSADLENGRHIAGIPTPWAIGFTEDTTKHLTLGATRAWTTSELGASAGFLEFTGQGLGELRMAIIEKELQMAMLGARAITPEVGGSEAVETVRMRAVAESASLADIAGAMESQMIRALRWFEFWMGSTEGTEPGTTEDPVSLVMNRDFVSVKLTPAEVGAWTNALILNRISFATYFHNLQERQQ